MRTEAYFFELGCCFPSRSSKPKLVEIAPNGELLVHRQRRRIWQNKIEKRIPIATATVEMVDDKVRPELNISLFCIFPLSII
jgi:hypothetical protein